MVNCTGHKRNLETPKRNKAWNNLNNLCFFFQTLFLFFSGRQDREICMWVLAMVTFSSSMSLEVTREYEYNWGQNKPCSFLSAYDPELFIILRRTIQINVMSLQEPKILLSWELSKVTVDELTHLEMLTLFSFSL